MKKRTSRSASATRKTSSRSGTSAKTAATGSSPAKAKQATRASKSAKMVGTVGIAAKAKHATTAEFAASIAGMVSDMTPEQFKSPLVRSGIVSQSGKLNSKYKK